MTDPAVPISPEQAASTTARIDQFRKMADADPANELGHFSLGRAFLDAGQFADAIHSFDRVIGLNPNISKVYHLRAAAQLKLDQREAAIASLTQGVKTAHARGDLMPKNDMLKMLKELGVEAPDLGTTRQDQPVGHGEVLCKRCGRVGPKLEKPPFRGEFGQAIFENTCALCWKEAIAQGTKVINELRLPLADPQAQKMWDQHIREFLNLA